MRSRALALSTTLALVLLPSQLPAAALPLMRTEWQASAAELGWVVSAYLLGYAVAVLVVLPLTDRFRPSRVIALGALITTIANLVFAYAAQDVVTASLLRVVAGFGLAGVYMPGVRIVAQSSDPARRGAAVGLYVAAFYFGGSLSFLATGLLLQPFGWRGAALALGLIAVAALPVALASARGIVETTGERAHLDLRVLRNAPLVRTIAAYTGHSWELFIVRAWLAAFLAAAFTLRGLSPTDASATASQWAALMLALGVPGVFVGGWASDRIGRMRAALLYAIGSGAISIGFGTLLFAPWPALVAVGALYGAIVAADSAVYSTAVTELAPAGRVGSAQAIQAVAGFGIGSLGPVVAGATLDLGAGWIGPFIVAGVVGVATALPLAIGLRWRRSVAAL
ncbi:MAG TPA: MFS transporter [Candidatus Limnocylindria bacterium]|nr:MFS transporter [Candidatus Limnocylindria bacterium]